MLGVSSAAALAAYVFSLLPLLPPLPWLGLGDRPGPAWAWGAAGSHLAAFTAAALLLPQSAPDRLGRLSRRPAAAAGAAGRGWWEKAAAAAAAAARGGMERVRCRR